MTLANYISDLLYRYDCVIVPNFGGFVTNKIGVKVNNYTHTFYPPTKQVSFNTHLKHNDGLLANYIASAQNISFEKANEIIDATVATWQKQLKDNSVEIETVGNLVLNKDNQLVFEPNTSSNFLTESFGLSVVESPAVKRYKEQVIPIVSADKEEATTKKGIPVFIKYAASAAILLTLGLVGYKAINQTNQQQILTEQQQKVEEKIQQATFVIDTPLPTINLNVEKETTAKYHIIAGAFEFVENADKKLRQLQRKGFKDAQIIGKNKWGLIQVTYASLSNERNAINTLRKIQRTSSKDAWLFVEK